MDSKNRSEERNMKMTKNQEDIEFLKGNFKTLYSWIEKLDEEHNLLRQHVEEALFKLEELSE